MDISLHTNPPNLVTQYTLQSTNKALETTIERIATGFKVNSVSDDAAGLQIASRLEAQSRGMGVAMRNSQDAISMLQMAEGTMDEMTNIAFHMYELATQAASDSNSEQDQEAMNSEFKALAEQLVNMQASTRFAGQHLLGPDGMFSEQGGVRFQVGSNSKDGLNVDVSDVVTAIFAVSQDLVSNHSILSQSEARTSMDMLIGDSDESEGSGVISILGFARSMFGAQINALDHNISNLENMLENLDEAKGRIVDNDISKA